MGLNLSASSLEVSLSAGSAYVQLGRFSACLSRSIQGEPFWDVSRYENGGGFRAVLCGLALEVEITQLYTSGTFLIDL